MHNKEKGELYSDFANVESYRNEVTSEEFPEGPYGSPILSETIGKSTPWREDQSVINPFGYENKQLHEGLPRDYPGDYDMTD